ncbi:MAG: NAD(P)-dependent oxidoreductase, partial [Tateyamaria sp.]
DTSTIEYGLTLSIGERLEALGLTFLDAPVSGMWKRAQEGTLTMMIGGDGQIVEKLTPALSTMANRILHTGAVGSGQLTKLINQLLFDINVAALAEILPMAVKLGLDPENTAEVVNSGTGRSYASEYFIPQILEGTFDTGYPLQSAYKDLISGAEISARYQIPAPVLAAAAFFVTKTFTVTRQVPRSNDAGCSVRALSALSATIIGQTSSSADQRMAVTPSCTPAWSRA